MVRRLLAKRRETKHGALCYTSTKAETGKDDGNHPPKIFYRTQQRVSSVVNQNIDLTVQALSFLEDCWARSCVGDIEFEDTSALVFDGGDL